MRTQKGEMKTSLKKGAWSLEEDRMLIAYINRYGIWIWSHMPKYAGLLRSGKSCRLRWMNYLKPDLKKGCFSEEEEEEEQSILHFHSILGNKWSAIARELPGRSDNEIKNYWHTNLKKRATSNPVIKGSKQKDKNKSPCFASHNVEKTKEDVNNANGISDFHFSWTSGDDSSTSSGTPTLNEHQVEFIADVCSPGTVEDLRCFGENFTHWQTWISENLIRKCFMAIFSNIHMMIQSQRGTSTAMNMKSHNQAFKINVKSFRSLKSWV